MKKEISQNEFVEMFDNCGRGNQFSRMGREELFDFLDSVEDDYELDIIAICCEFTEYKDIEEYLNDYNTDVEMCDYGLDEEGEYKEAIMDEIEAQTMVMKIDEDSFVIQDY